MADPYAIVLVRTEAGRALMADGPCGARAPSAAESVLGTWHEGWSEGRRIGLPVWWAGKPHPDGWWRAWCLWTADVSRPAPCPVRPDRIEVLAIGMELEARGLCRVVLLELEHVDGALVEVSP